MTQPTPNDVTKWLEDYFAMSDEITAHEAMQDDLRRVISAYVQEHGAIKVERVGSAMVTPASTSHSYDTKEIDNVIARVIQLSTQAQSDGDIDAHRKFFDIAQALIATRKETTRKATLRITKAK